MKKCLSVILCVVSPFLFNSAIALSGTSFPYTATIKECTTSSDQEQKSIPPADNQQQKSVDQLTYVPFNLCKATPEFLVALKEFQASKKTPDDIKNFKTTAKNAVIDKFFDMADFAKAVLGYTWGQDSSANLQQQRKDFCEALLNYIVAEYVKNLQEYTVSKVQFSPVMFEDGLTKIKSTVYYQKDNETKELSVGYTLNSSGKITDVTVLIDGSTPVKFQTLLGGALGNATNTLQGATQQLKNQTRSTMEPVGQKRE